MIWWITSVLVVVAYVCAIVYEAKHAPTVDDNKSMTITEREH